MVLLFQGTIMLGKMVYRSFPISPLCSIASLVQV
uniref:Uncharacterized protein n=1 Tax=Anguilla anguilla TaxID=7936 RepID=A0A0E9U0Y7_ANGAN